MTETGSTAAVTELADRLASGDARTSSTPDGSRAILLLGAGKILWLNPTGSFLVERIEAGARTAEELRDALVEEFEVAPERAAEDVVGFLAELGQALGSAGR